MIKFRVHVDTIRGCVCARPCCQGVIICQGLDDDWSVTACELDIAAPELDIPFPAV